MEEALEAAARKAEDLATKLGMTLQKAEKQAIRDELATGKSVQEAAETAADLSRRRSGVADTQRTVDAAVSEGAAARRAEGGRLADRVDPSSPEVVDAASPPVADGKNPFSGDVNWNFDPTSGRSYGGAKAAIGLGAAGAAGATGYYATRGGDPVAAATDGTKTLPTPPPAADPASGGATPSATGETAKADEPKRTEVGYQTRNFAAEKKRLGLDSEVAAVDTPQEFRKAYETVVQEGAKLSTDERLDEQTRANAARLESKTAELKSLYEENRDRLGWFQLAEVLGNALAKIGAAQYGLKNGVDMSGTKFTYRDWEKDYDRLMAERRQSLGEAEKQYAADADVIAGQRRALEQWRSRRDAASRDLTQASADAAKETRSARRERLSQLVQLSSSIEAGNIDAANAASRLQAQLDADDAREKRRADAEFKKKAAQLSDVEKQLLEMRQQQFNKDYSDYVADRNSYVEGVALIERAKTAPSKDREKLLTEGFEKVSKLMDPEQLGQFAEKSQSGWIWKKTDPTDLLGLIRSAEARTKPEPVAEDYLAGRAGASAAPRASTPAATKRTPVRKFQNRELNKTRIEYSDGSVEVVDGLQ